jgi:dihydrofolate reductase
MRKLTFGGVNSLDNYFARTDESVDWILWSDESAALMSSFWKTIDTILWGRKTYEFAVRNGHPPDYPGVQNYVFSRTLTQIDASATLVHEDAVAFVRRLKSEDGPKDVKDICLMGGGQFAKSLFEADLIDEIGFTIHPILLGSGIPLFHPMSRQINLELKECKAFKNGCVHVSYRIIHTQ